MRELKTALGIVASALVVLVVLPLPAAAQDPAAHGPIHPYVFVGPGGISNGGATMHVGGGVDLIARNGLGASIEGGYLGPVEAIDYGIGIVSANAIYQIGAARRGAVTPFVTGGYSLGFRGETANAVNVGAGMNWWMKDGLALRLEVRDHMPVSDATNLHLWGLRVGFTWR